MARAVSRWSSGKVSKRFQDAISHGRLLEINATYSSSMASELRLLRAPDEFPLRTYTIEEEALCIAVEKDAYASLDLLLEKGVSASAVSAQGHSALHTAARRGKTDIVKLLLLHGANVHTLSWPNQCTALWGALSANTRDNPNISQSITELLLSAGADPNAREQAGLGSTILSYTAILGNTGMMRLLLEKGALTSSRCKHNETALMMACRSGRSAATLLLLEKGADVNARHEYMGNHRTALCHAIQSSFLPGLFSSLDTRPHDISIIRSLLAYGAAINGDAEIEPPLSLAVGARGETTCAKIHTLLDAGADIEKPNRAGFTPLNQWLEGPSWANEPVLVLLLDRGANPNKLSPSGKTPLTHVCSVDTKYRPDRIREIAKILRILISHGADTVADGNGDTPLMALGWNSGMKSEKTILTEILMHPRAKEGGTELSGPIGRRQQSRRY